MDAAGWAPSVLCALCRTRHKAHLVRNTFRYASRKDWDAIAKDLRPVYTALTAELATLAFDEFTNK